MKDEMQTTDSIEVAIDTSTVAPKYPCPKCGKESKEHNVFDDSPEGPKQVKGARICSDRSCREEFNLLN